MGMIITDEHIDYLLRVAKLVAEPADLLADMSTVICTLKQERESCEKRWRRALALTTLQMGWHGDGSSVFARNLRQGT
jgi:hypothetical protein